MKYKVISPSDVFPLDVDFLKLQLHLTHDAHDVLLLSLIKAATGWASGYTGRQINFSTLLGYMPLGELTLSSCFRIERGPVIAVQKLEYVDVDGAVHEVQANNYELFKEELAGVVFVKSDAVDWSTVHPTRSDAIRATFTAGYGGTGVSAIAFPEEVKNAVTIKAARMYTNPDDSVDEKITVSENLLKSFRCAIV